MESPTHAPFRPAYACLQRPFQDHSEHPVDSAKGPSRRSWSQSFSLVNILYMNLHHRGKTLPTIVVWGMLDGLETTILLQHSTHQLSITSLLSQTSGPWPHMAVPEADNPSVLDPAPPSHHGTGSVDHLILLFSIRNQRILGSYCWLPCKEGLDDLDSAASVFPL